MPSADEEAGAADFVREFDFDDIVAYAVGLLACLQYAFFESLVYKYNLSTSICATVLRSVAVGVFSAEALVVSF